jgi:dienelactone hydrolase
MAGVTIALRIENPRGFRLAADLTLPPGHGPFPAVVCVHDPSEGKESPIYRQLAGVLVGQGMAVMLLDLTGQGQSDGGPEDATAEAQMEDVGAALEELERRPDVDAQRVGGYGAGGAALPLVLRAEGDPRLRALVLRCPRPGGAFDALRKVALPTLLIVGAGDRAALEDALAIDEALVGEKRVVVAPEIDCYPTDLAYMQQAAVLAADWFRKHLV